MSSLSSKIFYGNKKPTLKSVQIMKRTRMMKERPIPGIHNANILGESKIWKIFSKQNLALEFAVEQNGLGLMVFAFEGKTVGEGGCRKFVVCHPKLFWKNFEIRPLVCRCSYEVIPEHHACKLYFDLEFSRNLNPKLVGDDLTKTFIRIVNFYLEKQYGILFTDEDVLILDSTTDQKFSNHLIYRNSFGFANNFEAGQFVNDICKDLKEIADGTLHPEIPVEIDDIMKLFVYNANSSKNIFCDEAVYTKNRNFRTYKSTKLGKQTPFVLSHKNKYKPFLGTHDLDYFLDSLVTYIPDDAFIVSNKSDAVLMCPKRKLKETEISTKPSSYNFSSSFSPYPEIESFITEYLGGGHLIRTWQYFSESELLVFDISKKHRFCHNIGREHKSNSVMYVVNLRKEVFYQKCHDFECRGFKSNEFPLPRWTMPWKNLENFDDDDDAIFIEAAEQVEKLLSNGKDVKGKKPT